MIKKNYKHLVIRFTQNSKDLLKASNDVIKWSVLAIVIGILVGFGVAWALKLLEYCIQERNIHIPSLFLFLPLLLGTISYLLFRFYKEVIGDGTEEIIKEAIYSDRKLNVSRFFLKQVANFCTMIFGGSVGKEAPSAQMGAYFSKITGKLFHIRTTEQIILIITGTSAGFAVVFGAPIAAGFFALEALFAGKILYRVLVPSLISSFIAYWCMHIVDIHYIYHPVTVGLVPNFWELFNIIKTVFAGLLFGFLAYLFIVLMQWSGKLALSETVHPFLKGFLGGVILVAVAFTFGDQYLGLGLRTIDLSLSHETQIAWYTPFIKLFTTFVTLGSGGSGGFVTPILFVGATFGNFLGHLLDSNISLFAALGFVSVLSGATNAPIASTILAAELFGIETAHFAAVTSIISYLISSKKSVFDPEILDTIEQKFNRHIH
ncbi:chloride channel protein [Nitratiruptor sp. SB155-2]|uniref:chloride channel protein n=1 Tax=Nitratiruptor sp. (strain SB155-2) TaxID=387092 RepID=UPI000158705F|nr:chloride channel protein [Nitratiruptor sp. SB155-2]BAF70258.1 voltage-gated chloride channel [Nitratiruptor sp. SB155-2]